MCSGYKGIWEKVKGSDYPEEDGRKFKKKKAKDLTEEETRINNAFWGKLVNVWIKM